MNRIIRQIYFFITCFCLVPFLTVVGAGPVPAQQPAGGLNSQQLNTPTPLPEFKPAEPEPKMILPEPEWPVDHMLSNVPFVRVDRFIFEGNTVISDEELNRIALPYTRIKISTRELQRLRRDITLYYVNNGYINSGAVLPDQKVENNTIVIRIIEGRLSDIAINGLKHIRKSYVTGRLSPEPDVPFNINDLQKKLQLLHKSPLIRKINGELSPGLNPGDAFLSVHITEAAPLSGSVTYANDSPPSSGSLGPEAELRHMNLTGRGDSVLGRYKKTRGAEDIHVEYAFPVSSKDTRLGFSYDVTDSSIIEEPFDLIDIKSHSETCALSISHPLIKTADRELTVTVSAENRSSETFLFDRPFSFSNNTRDGRTVINVGRLAVDWQLFRPSEVFAVRTVVSAGFDVFDTTDFIARPDGEFIAVLGQAQWARRLDLVPNDQLICRASFQLANDGLPAMERFSVGGVNTVRGFRENEWVKDNGIAASVEYRMPVFRLPLFHFSRTLRDGMVELAPFADWGRSWNKSGYPDTEIISSIGAGLRWTPTPGIHARVYFAHGLNNVSHDSRDLQDSGVHFYVRCDLFRF